ncbi:hypothetical protein QBC44DRAFT_385713 [Cladorrhinum sp. PSN332]|nr:hypothetical protein QBC44DRAFT_385713 [Cladorrhinum sp. PSN332]
MSNTDPKDTLIIEDVTEGIDDVTLGAGQPQSSGRDNDNYIVDWTNKQARQYEIKRLGLSHIPTEPGLPNGFRQWRTRDKFVYTVLLTLVKDPDALAAAFGLKKETPTAFDMDNPDYQDFLLDVKYVNAAYKGLVDEWRRDSFREMIVDRWRWLNLEDKYEIILKTFPDIAPKHRIDIYECPKLEADGKYRATTAPAQAYLTPQINLEDLIHGDHMLVLVRERMINEPRKFVHGDLERARVERLGKGIAFPFLYAGSVNLEGTTATDNEYGDVITGKDLEDFVDSEEVAGYALTVNDGILAIKIQARIFRGCTKFFQIMRDLPSKQDKILNQTPFDDGFRLGVHSILALHMHYKGQQHPLKAIKTLALRKAEESRRRLWLMRNNPKEFHGWALEYFAHAPEHAHDSDGKVHSDLNDEPGMMDMYDRCITALIANTYTRCIQWEILTEFMEEGDDHSYDKPRKWKKWSREQHELFLLSLLKLRKILYFFMMRRLAGTLVRTAAVHPELSDYFVREKSTRTQISMRPGSAEMANDDVIYLFSLVSQAYNDHPDPRYRKKTPSLVPLDDVFIELNRKSDLKKIRRASKHLETEIKEAGLLGLIVNHMRLTDPFGIIFSSLEGTDGAVLNLLPEIKENMDGWMTNVLNLINELDSVMRCIDTNNTRGEPRLAKGGRRLEEVLKTNDKEEHHDALGQIWMVFDLHCEANGSDTLMAVLKRTLRKATEEARV